MWSARGSSGSRWSSPRSWAHKTRRPAWLIGVAVSVTSLRVVGVARRPLRPLDDRLVLAGTTITFHVNDTEREELVGPAARESVTLSDYDRVRLGLRAQGSQGDAERPGRPVASRRHLLLLAQT